MSDVAKLIHHRSGGWRVELYRDASAWTLFDWHSAASPEDHFSIATDVSKNEVKKQASARWPGCVTREPLPDEPDEEDLDALGADDEDD